MENEIAETISAEEKELLERFINYARKQVTLLKDFYLKFHPENAEAVQDALEQREFKLFLMVDVDPPGVDLKVFTKDGEIATMAHLRMTGRYIPNWPSDMQLDPKVH